MAQEPVDPAGAAESQRRLIQSLTARRSLSRSLQRRLEAWLPPTVQAWPKLSFAPRLPYITVKPAIPARSAFRTVADSPTRVEGNWSREEFFWWRRLAPIESLLGKHRQETAIRVVTPASPPPGPDEPPRVIGEFVGPPTAPPDLPAPSFDLGAPPPAAMPDGSPAPPAEVPGTPALDAAPGDGRFTESAAAPAADPAAYPADLGMPDADLDLDDLDSPDGASDPRPEYSVPSAPAVPEDAPPLDSPDSDAGDTDGVAQPAGLPLVSPGVPSLPSPSVPSVLPAVAPASPGSPAVQALAMTVAPPRSASPARRGDPEVAGQPSPTPAPAPAVPQPAAPPPAGSAPVLDTLPPAPPSSLTSPAPQSSPASPGAPVPSPSTAPQPPGATLETPASPAVQALAAPPGPAAVAAPPVAAVAAAAVVTTMPADGSTPAAPELPLVVAPPPGRPTSRRRGARSDVAPSPETSSSAPSPAEPVQERPAAKLADAPLSAGTAVEQDEAPSTTELSELPAPHAVAESVIAATAPVPAPAGDETPSAGPAVQSDAAEPTAVLHGEQMGSLAAAELGAPAAATIADAAESVLQSAPAEAEVSLAPAVPASLLAPSAEVEATPVVTALAQAEPGTLTVEPLAGTTDQPAQLARAAAADAAQPAGPAEDTGAAETAPAAEAGALPAASPGTGPLVVQADGAPASAEPWTPLDPVYSPSTQARARQAAASETPAAPGAQRPAASSPGGTAPGSLTPATSVPGGADAPAPAVARSVDPSVVASPAAAADAPASSTAPADTSSTAVPVQVDATAQPPAAAAAQATAPASDTPPNAVTAGAPEAGGLAQGAQAAAEPGAVQRAAVASAEPGIPVVPGAPNPSAVAPPATSPTSAATPAETLSGALADAATGVTAIASQGVQGAAGAPVTADGLVGADPAAAGEAPRTGDVEAALPGESAGGPEVVLSPDPALASLVAADAVPEAAAISSVELPAAASAEAAAQTLAEGALEVLAEADATASGPDAAEVTSEAVGQAPGRLAQTEPASQSGISAQLGEPAPVALAGEPQEASETPAEDPQSAEELPRVVAEGEPVAGAAWEPLSLEYGPGRTSRAPRQGASGQPRADASPAARPAGAAVAAVTGAVGTADASAASGDPGSAPTASTQPAATSQPGDTSQPTLAVQETPAASIAAPVTPPAAPATEPGAAGSLDTAASSPTAQAGEPAQASVASPTSPATQPDPATPPLLGALPTLAATPELGSPIAAPVFTTSPTPVPLAPGALGAAAVSETPAAVPVPSHTESPSEIAASGPVPSLAENAGSARAGLPTVLSAGGEQAPATPASESLGAAPDAASAEAASAEGASPDTLAQTDGSLPSQRTVPADPTFRAGRGQTDLAALLDIAESLDEGDGASEPGSALAVVTPDRPSAEDAPATLWQRLRLLAWRFTPGRSQAARAARAAAAAAGATALPGASPAAASASPALQAVQLAQAPEAALSQSPDQTVGQAPAQAAAQAPAADLGPITDAVFRPSADRPSAAPAAEPVGAPVDATFTEAPSTAVAASPTSPVSPETASATPATSPVAASPANVDAPVAPDAPALVARVFAPDGRWWSVTPEGEVIPADLPAHAFGEAASEPATASGAQNAALVAPLAILLRRQLIAPPEAVWGSVSTTGRVLWSPTRRSGTPARSVSAASAAASLGAVAHGLASGPAISRTTNPAARSADTVPGVISVPGSPTAPGIQPPFELPAALAPADGSWSADAAALADVVAAGVPLEMWDSIPGVSAPDDAPPYAPDVQAAALVPGALPPGIPPGLFELLPAQPEALSDDGLARVIMSLPPALAARMVEAGVNGDGPIVAPGLAEALSPRSPVSPGLENAPWGADAWTDGASYGPGELEASGSAGISAFAGASMVYAPGPRRAGALRAAEQAAALAGPMGRGASPAMSPAAVLSGIFGSSTGFQPALAVPDSPFGAGSAPGALPDGSAWSDSGGWSDLGSGSWNGGFPGVPSMPASDSSPSGAALSAIGPGAAAFSRAPSDRPVVQRAGEDAPVDTPASAPSEGPDVDRLADEIYRILRWRLVAERERSLL